MIFGRIGVAMKKAIALFLISVMLCSCSLIRNEASVENFIDESVIAEWGAEHSSTEEFVKIIKIITNDSTELMPFSDPKTVADVYRDRILAHLVSIGYSKYTGNTAKITEAEKKYPKMRISVLVPYEDFEYIVYSSFGGAKTISHKDGTVFSNLSRVGGYTAVGQVNASTAEVEITSVKETDNTFIVTFYTLYGGEYSPLYKGVFVKRDDGSVYLGMLERIADKKISVPTGTAFKETSDEEN